MLTYNLYVPLFCSRVGIPCLYPAEIDLFQSRQCFGLHPRVLPLTIRCLEYPTFDRVNANFRYCGIWTDRLRLLQQTNLWRHRGMVVNT